MTSGSDNPGDPARDQPAAGAPGDAPQPSATPYPPASYSQPYPSQGQYPSQPYPPQGQYPPQPYPPQGQYPPQPYPPQQGYQVPQGYQPPYPEQPYQQPRYPQPPYPYQTQAPQPPAATTRPAAPPRSPFLGRVSLLLVSISAVAAVLAVIPIGQVMARVMLSAGTTQIDNETMRAALQSQAAGPSSVFGLVMAVGIASALTGLAAAISGRGRGAGIAAAVVGVLAPVAWMVALMVTIYPAVASLVG